MTKMLLSIVLNILILNISDTVIISCWYVFQSEKCFVSKLGKYLWGFPVHSIYNNAFMTFVLSFFVSKFGGGGIEALKPILTHI